MGPMMTLTAANEPAQEEHGLCQFSNLCTPGQTGYRNPAQLQTLSTVMRWHHSMKFGPDLCIGISSGGPTCPACLLGLSFYAADILVERCEAIQSVACAALMCIEMQRSVQGAVYTFRGPLLLIVSPLEVQIPARTSLSDARRASDGTALLCSAESALGRVMSAGMVQKAAFGPEYPEFRPLCDFCL